MKIFDCFMYFDEEVILETRLNILDPYVDYFVIVESKFNHKGERRTLKFQKENYQKFKSKIKYVIIDVLPPNLEKIQENDEGIRKEHKFINNAIKRENFQRNFIEQGLIDANKNDLILISDVDEIPNLKELNLSSVKEKIIIFEQIMTYYKFNLALPNFKWHGTKGCLKKNLKSPQWLRNVKSKKYSLLRLDILFSEKRYNNVKFIKDGGWHFTNIKTAKEIEHKFKSYLHHREFELSNINLNDIKKIISNKVAIYDLSVDQRDIKICNGKKLVNLDDNKLPEYVIKNKHKLSVWFE